MYLAKVSFNDNHWRKPSGLKGKCKSFFTGIYFEWQNGFGWEEWNFSKNRILDDGYQYGFLQAVNFDEKLRNKTYKNVVLFTTICSDGELPKNYIIGYIQELESLSHNASRIARESLNQNGVIVQMNKDIVEIDADLKAFNENINTCINVRYKLSDIKLFWGKVAPSILEISLSANFTFKEIFEIKNKTEDNIITIIKQFSSEFKKIKD